MKSAGRATQACSNPPDGRVLHKRVAHAAAAGVEGGGKGEQRGAVARDERAPLAAGLHRIYCKKEREGGRQRRTEQGRAE